ncbi:MAG TPA: alkaline phosphatase family protein, partial [Myxococcales bacterium]|nr:alkaline phosphatase family protein [Myxococcales bacterium]
MENRNREEIESGRDAPYLSGSVWPRASYATEYFNPPKVHPSLPNYLWLIAGDDYGKGLDDSDPSVGGDELATENHLPGLLARAGWTWREYAEGIDGKHCPLASAGGYLCKHNPFVYFDGLTGGLNPDDGLCRAHNRPFSELAADLAGGRVANFNFITPDRCHDMHDCATRSGDDWLSQQLPPILASRPYREAGAVFIVWDEGSDGSDGPLPFAVLSPFAKGGGYHDAVHYDHSSTLKTVEEIFGLSPLLGHAADPAVEDLSDLFQPFVIRGRGSLPARPGG